MDLLDVVPVEPSTVDQWEHPPFSGFNDGKLSTLPLRLLRIYIFP